MSEPIVRRAQSKAARNERRKAAATTLIAAGIAIAAAMFIQPMAGGPEPRVLPLLAAFFLIVASQAFAHYILSRIED